MSTQILNYLYTERHNKKIRAKGRWCTLSVRINQFIVYKTMLFLFIHSMLYDWAVHTFARSLTFCEAGNVDLSSMKGI